MKGEERIRRRKERKYEKNEGKEGKPKIEGDKKENKKREE